MVSEKNNKHWVARFLLPPTLLPHFVTKLGRNKNHAAQLLLKTLSPKYPSLHYPFLLEGFKQLILMEMEMKKSSICLTKKMGEIATVVGRMLTIFLIPVIII